MLVTPRVKPALPVAVEFAEMEKYVGGSWALGTFNADEDLYALEHEIKAKLMEKVDSPVYLQLHVKTLTEFVKKWLVTQEPCKTGNSQGLRCCLRTSGQDKGADVPVPR